MSESETQLFIIGAGGHGSELYSYASAMPNVHFAGFVDDNKPAGTEGGIHIVGGFDQMRSIVENQPATEFRYITAAGNNAVRRTIVDRIEQFELANLSPWVLRDPSADIGRNVDIGDGTCLAPHSIITTNTRIGKHCIVNIKASVSHDCLVGPFSNINPGATICGSVTLGQHSYIGAGSTIIEQITIGDNVIVGAGAVVIRDVPSNVTVAGVPATVIKGRAV